MWSLLFFLTKYIVSTVTMTIMATPIGTAITIVKAVSERPPPDPSLEVVPL